MVFILSLSLFCLLVPFLIIYQIPGKEEKLILLDGDERHTSLAKTMESPEIQQALSMRRRMALSARVCAGRAQCGCLDG